jgi:hypothetical protein
MTDGFPIKKWKLVNPHYAIIHFLLTSENKRERARLKINGLEHLKQGLQITDGLNLNSGQKAVAFLSNSPSEATSWIAYV